MKNNLRFILDVYREELLNYINQLDTINRKQVVEININDYRLFIDINNKVYTESNKKISGKTFGKQVGYLHDNIIYLE